MRTLLVAALLGAMACAPSPAAPVADLLLTGGTVLTGAPGTGISAVAIRAGRVLAVGTDAQLQRHRGDATRVVNLEGSVVAPAWVDHHVHLLNVGLSVRNAQTAEALFVDLGGMDLAAIDATLRSRAPQGDGDGWLLGKGWSQGAWGSEMLPDRETIDAASGEAAVFLGRVDGHAAWADGDALAAAGIDAATPDPPGGRIERRPDGSPTGVLLERAAEPVQALLPRPAWEELVAAMRLGAETMAAQGVVEVFDAGFLTPPGVVNLGDDLERYLEALVEADRTRPLPVRVNLMVPAPTELAETVVAEPARFRELSPRLRVTHLKLFADGAMGSRGAWLREPFADDPTTAGVPRMEPGEIATWSRRALAAGLDVATHAIGDAALTTVLDVYAELLEERPDLDPRRLRIEHVSFGSREDLLRAAELGVVLSVQPNFVLPDDEGRAMEDSRLGPERADTVYAWATLQRAGAELAFGSDYFTFPFPPLFTLHAATRRSNLDGRPRDGWHPDERLPLVESLALMSTLYGPGGGAPHRHHVAAGEPADLVILSADPLAADDLLAIAVRGTLVAGRTVHADGVVEGLVREAERPARAR